jgi:selenocysteine-specific elongation factor
VQIHLEKPAILVNGDRFIIRNSSNDMTLGGGVVIDTTPLHHRKRTPVLIENLKNLVEATINSDNLFNLIKIELKKENAPVFAQFIAGKLNKTGDEIVDECKNNNAGSGYLFQHSEKTILIDKDIHKEYHQKVLNILKEEHQKYPILEEGFDTKEFYGKFGFTKNDAGKSYVDMLMEQMLEEGLVKRVGNSFALSDHTVTIDNKTQEQLDWLESVLEETGIDLPDFEKIENMALHRKIKKERLKMLLKYLARQNKLVFYQGEYLHKNVVDRSRKILLSDLKNKELGINEKEFRLLLNTTKKFIQVILGILIEEGTVYKKTFYILLTDKGKEMTSEI